MAIVKTLDILLRAPTGQLTRDLKAGDKQFKAFASKVGSIFTAALGAISIGAFVGKIKTALTELDGLAKRSVQFGIDTTELQGLELAASLSGASVEQLATANRKLLQSISQSNQGLKTQSDAFEKIGVSSKDLGRATATQRLIKIAEGLGKIEDTADRADVALRLLGRNGLTLLPLLANKASALADAANDVEKLGGAFSAKELLQIESANDAYTRLEFTVKALFGRIAISLAPAIEQLTKTFTAAVQPGSLFNGVLKGVGDLSFIVLRITGALANSLNMLAGFFGSTAGRVISYVVALFAVVRVTRAIIAVYTLLQAKAKALLAIEILRGSLTGKNAVATAAALGVGAATITTALIALNQFDKQLGATSEKQKELTKNFGEFADAGEQVSRQKINLTSATIGSQSSFETIFGAKLDSPINKVAGKIDTSNDLLAQMRDALNQARGINFEVDEVTF